MREILFRGKSIADGKWVEGYLSFVYVNGRNENGFIYSNNASIYSQEDCRGYCVLTDTIGQYTGLTDKNGKKVFEGDIIRVIYESNRMPENIAETWAELYTVVFNDRHHAWYTKLDNGEFGESLYEYDNDCEVIGNIHDVLELLEGA